MALLTDCNQNTDPLKLVREGTSQEQRLSPALDPAYAPVNEHAPAHGMVFASAYSAFLKYYNASNVASGDWKPFFSEDVSVQLAIATVQNVADYQSSIKSYFDFLNNLENQSDATGIKNNLGHLFSCAATLAQQLDAMKEVLPAEIALKGMLKNLIQSQLAPAFNRLISYYKADLLLPLADRLIADTHPNIVILGETAVAFNTVYGTGLSQDWVTTNALDWNAYKTSITPDASVFGTGVSVFERANHIATHNLFTSILDQFLKVYARTVNEAKTALEVTFTSYDDHQPHYTLFLAFLRLLEYARAEANTLTGRHLDFYYREILRLKEKPAEPGHAHLLVELAKHVQAHELQEKDLLKAGKDDLGIEAFFANDRDFVANQAKVAAVKTVYRHDTEQVKNPEIPVSNDTARLYASPVANSDDGAGAELISEDKSWHPFFNKIYADGELKEIRMPKAEVGFVVASHYLWMAEGTRTVTIDFTVKGSFSLTPDRKDDIVCLFTSEKGWIEKNALTFSKQPSGVLQLKVELSGADPAVTPYLAKTHGYDFATPLPVLLIKLKHKNADAYIYTALQDLKIQKIDLKVKVAGLKSLAVSNDFGVVDTSKPFQPFGAQPVNGGNFIVGSKEVFQKKLLSASLQFIWQNPPAYYQSQTTGVTSTAPKVDVSYLNSGKWSTPVGDFSFNTSDYSLNTAPNATVVESVELLENEPYSVAARNGYLRLVLEGDLGFKQYQIDLGNFLADITPKPPSHPGAPLLGPFATAVSMNYEAAQEISLNSGDNFEDRNALFLHLAPFGQAEQHPWLKNESKAPDVNIYLLPQFYHEPTDTGEAYDAELYIGVVGLQPPQNLALLFEVADGTADPLSQKPDPHIHWSYLRGNEWVSFANNEVEDLTNGLLKSGIVTFAVPREATNTNTLLATGMHWIRAAVASESDAVCRLKMVAAQALRSTFENKGNDPAFPTKVLPSGTVNKLDQPDAAVKKIIQPFATFGGRGQELPNAFYTRVSERLRHKDRAIALWDYERLVLEAFPQVYKVKCLNHTEYEPTESNVGVYRELAPGHVTIVTIPNQQFQNLRDPLRPYTSLGLLQEIDAFLRKRLSCFVKLHVRNPQFEEVRVSFRLRLYDGFDETFYSNKLREDITRFLSPWAFPGGGSPSFGGKIYKSVLINFVEEQPYVDYVTDFQLFHDIGGVKGTSDKNEVEGSKAVSILVSVSAIKHSIQVIKPAEAETPRENCPCEA